MANLKKIWKYDFLWYTSTLGLWVSPLLRFDQNPWNKGMEEVNTKKQSWKQQMVMQLSEIPDLTPLSNRSCDNSFLFNSQQVKHPI